jgi:putative membrane protein
MIKLLVLFLKALVIGIANAVPGVSGGTIAYILNEYEFLINGLSLNFKYIFKNFLRYLVFGFGTLVGVIGFAVVLDNFLYANYPLILNLSFIGLIIGGLNFIFEQTKVKISKVVLNDLILIMIGFSVVILPSLFGEIENQVLTTLNINDFFGLLGAGLLGSIAMITPGISGSFVMLALGYYQTIINAISDFNLIIMLPVVVGAVIGLVGGARLIKYLLSNFKLPLYKLILGFVLGSLFTIDTAGFGLNLQSFIGSGFLIIFAALTYKISKLKSA